MRKEDGINMNAYDSKKVSVVSALIFTRNERENISKLLPYLARYIKRFVFVDALSTDGTKEICERFGVVYETKPIGYVEPCRMYGISKVPTEWILYLDADEYPSKFLLETLVDIIDIAERKGYCAISIRRINSIGPKKTLRNLFRSDFQVRIFKRGCVNYIGMIHEQPQIRGEVLKLIGDRIFIYHKAYNTYSLKAIRSRKIIFYAKLAGLMRENRATSIVLVLCLPLTYLLRLIKYLLIKRGILDGLAGLEATLVYTTYLTLVDIFKATRPTKLNFISRAISSGRDLNFLCKPIDTP